MGFNVLGFKSQLLQRYHPARDHEGSSHLSLIFVLRTFIALQVQHYFYCTTRQLMVEITYSRSHAFRCKTQNKNPNFHKNRNHDFRTTSGYTRGYLLDLPCVRYGTYEGIPPVYIAGTTGTEHSSGRSGATSTPISDTSVSSVQRQNIPPVPV